jgi:hypothetical protein
VSDEDTTHADAAGPGEGTTASGAHVGAELKERFKQITQPLVDSLDARLARQVDAHLDAHLGARIDEALSARLAVIERAIADLDRSVRELRGGDA